MDNKFVVDKRYRVLPGHTVAIMFRGKQLPPLKSGEEFDISIVSPDGAAIITRPTGYHYFISAGQEVHVEEIAE